MDPPEQPGVHPGPPAQPGTGQVCGGCLPTQHKDLLSPLPCSSSCLPRAGDCIPTAVTPHGHSSPSPRATAGETVPNTTWGNFWERTAPAARAGGVPHSQWGRQKCQEPILIPRAPESQSQADCSLLPCSWAPAGLAPYVPCVPWAVPLHSSPCWFPRKEWLCVQEQDLGFGYHCRGKGGKGCRYPPLLATSLTRCLPTCSQCPTDAVPSPTDVHAMG